ncbi:MAG: hypothetical protein ACYDEB_06855 [Dehalococcoidia bacterium]
MIRRARSFFRDSEAGVAVTVGVVGGLALYYVLSAIGQGLVIGYIEHRTRAGQLLLTEFTIAGVTFNYQLFVGPAAALALIAVLAYVLFLWPGGEPLADDSGTRDCPECKSEIWADARRCAYCTSVVTPLVESAEAEA